MRMKNLLFSALQTAQLILFKLDKEGTIVAMEGHDMVKLGLTRDHIGKSAFRVKNFPVKRSHFKNAEKLKAITVSVNVRNFVYETTLTPTIDKSGNFDGCSGVATDVTKRIQIEQELDEERYRASAAQRINSLAGMANGLAHEINNPLAIISGFSQQIAYMAESGKVDTNRLGTMVDRMIHTCDRIHKIICSLQDFSRDAGDDPVISTPISQIFNETLELCRGRFDAADVALEVSVFDKELAIPCRRVQISQTLFNLLTNSLESVSGSEKPWVRLSVDELSQVVAIYVTDSGKGIDPGIQTKIFEPFFTTKEVGDGAGLGLSTAKGIIESHGGNFLFDPQCPNTRFVIQLPKDIEQVLPRAG